MVTAIILISLGVLSIVAFLFFRIKSYSVKATIIKSIASLLFLALATYSFYHSGLHRLGIFVIIGGLLGLLGDIWLELKMVYPNDDKIYSYAGFIMDLKYLS